jgi:hypothetical protein
MSRMPTASTSVRRKSITVKMPGTSQIGSSGPRPTAQDTILMKRNPPNAAPSASPAGVVRKR